MDVLSIILTFLGAYGVFMLGAFLLARVFFPVLETGEGSMKEKPKRGKIRHHKA